MQIITLITDYGGRDYYVGALKGVILSIAPKVTLVDVTHEVEPHNILHGAFVLRSIWPWYPAGTIHLAIVDPGVGTERRILLGRYDGSYVVAPDNGVISFLHRELRTEAMHVVENPRFTLPPASSTFEGRDILAPVAAHLAQGVKPREFGRATDRVEVFPLPRRPEVSAQGLRGCVLYVDRFGTLVSNISRRSLLALGTHKAEFEVLVNDTSVGPILSTFGEVPAGEPVAIIGSTEHLEVAVNRGSAQERFGPVERVRILVR